MLSFLQEKLLRVILDGVDRSVILLEDLKRTIESQQAARVKGLLITLSEATKSQKLDVSLLNSSVIQLNELISYYDNLVTQSMNEFVSLLKKLMPDGGGNVAVGWLLSQPLRGLLGKKTMGEEYLKLMVDSQNFGFLLHISLILKLYCILALEYSEDRITTLFNRIKELGTASTEETTLPFGDLPIPSFVRELDEDTRKQLKIKDSGKKPWLESMGEWGSKAGMWIIGGFPSPKLFHQLGEAYYRLAILALEVKKADTPEALFVSLEKQRLT